MQYERAIQASLASTQPPEIDDDITKALKLSLSPAQQVNPEFRDHFQRLNSRNEAQPEVTNKQPEEVRGAESLAEFRVPDLEDLEFEETNIRSRTATKPKVKQPKVLKVCRIYFMY